ncbi:metallophosphoesterase [Bradyrhizobium cenepequi]
MKFVVLTDTHFVARGRRIYGLDPAERLAAAIACINRDHPDLAFVIVTGDLAHWGEDAAYDHLADVLARLNAPTILMMGNHDRRDAFGRYFPGVAHDVDGFVQSMQVFDAATIIALDTLNEAAPNHEAPDYSHVTVSGGQIVIHQCSFMYAGPRFSLHDQAALNGVLG